MQAKTLKGNIELFLIITFYQNIPLSLILCLFFVDIQVTKWSMIIAGLDLVISTPWNNGN